MHAGTVEIMAHNTFNCANY